MMRAHTDTRKSTYGTFEWEVNPKEDRAVGAVSDMASRALSAVQVAIGGIAAGAKVQGKVVQEPSFRGDDMRSECQSPR